MTRVFPYVTANGAVALTELTILSDGWESPLEVKLHCRKVLLPRASPGCGPVVEASFVFKQDRFLERLFLRRRNESSIYTVECHRELELVDFLRMSIANVARNKAAWMIELIFGLTEFDLDHGKDFRRSIRRRLHFRCHGCSHL